MPYVEGFGTWPFGEEWLWEAVACAYLPLLDLLDGAPVTVGLTPVLCDQFEAMRGDAGERYLRFLREIRATVHAEDAAGLERGASTSWPPRCAELRAITCSPNRPSSAAARDLVGAFRRLEGVELWTSAATHAVLPLLATDAALRLQLATGTTRTPSASAPGAAACGYPNVPTPSRASSGSSPITACAPSASIRPPSRASSTFTPVATDAGPVALPIDWATVKLVWNDRAGHPAHDGYRDYHRRTLHDLKPWDNAGRPTVARRAAARTQARERLRRTSASPARRRRPARAVRSTPSCSGTGGTRDRRLAALLEEAPRQGLELVTVSEGLERVAASPRPLVASSWGEHKDLLSTWDSAAVAGFAFTARDAELRTAAAAAREAPQRQALSEPHASSWPCSRATGHSWPSAGLRPTTRRSASRPTTPPTRKPWRAPRRRYCLPRPHPRRVFGTSRPTWT